MNKKGFTLIELLAVIVILGVLLAIAIPSVSKYINTAKKSTYIINVKEYADAAKKELSLIDADYQYPVNHGDVTMISFDELKIALENGGKKSSYGAEFVKDSSYVLVVNDGTGEKPHYTYFVSAIDEKGYAIGVKKTTSKAQLVAYDDLTNENVVQVGIGNGYSYVNVTTGSSITVNGSNIIIGNVTNYGCGDK